MRPEYSYITPRKTCVMDTEAYVNYWSIGFKCVDTGQMRRFRLWRDELLDVKGIAKIFYNWRVISFNGNGYDLPMIALAMSGATTGELKRASDGIIMSNIRPWQFYDLHGVSLPEYIDHIDLMEVSPGSPSKPSLKMYAGRLHSKRMQDLPFDPDRVLSEADVEALELYHVNDLDVTIDKYHELKAQIDLRCVMSEQYGVDLRSKSDPQIAEAVIVAEVEKKSGRRIYKPDVKPGLFNYIAPAWVKFQTPQMQEIFSRVCETPFVVKSNGEVEMPAFLEKTVITLGESKYQMGIGGLHSCEKSVQHFSDSEYLLTDRDVTSYYPSMIINGQWFPAHIGPAFGEVYKSIYERRVAAKSRANELSKQIAELERKINDQEQDSLKRKLLELKAERLRMQNEAESKKLSLNGSFGKFGSAYSKLYSPNLMIQTTITGQLAILMLIEQLELYGIHVVSANTDGFVTKVPRDRKAIFEAVILDWQWDTGLMTEETTYTSLSSRDVNNYIAIDSKGKVKLKGAFAKGGPGLPGASGMKKNPVNEVCIDAVIAYIKDGTPLIETIADCRDIRKFITVRRVNGGCLDQDGELVGKVVRFYYARGVTGTLTYKMNGNDVPKTEGAKPLMELPDEFPKDVDYAWYEREATAMLQELGIAVVDPALRNRTGLMYAHPADQVTVHQVQLPSAVALCGKRPKSIREAWKEVLGGPNGMRTCAACRKAAEL